jgi:peptidoglycan/xylan/chitin deacetylase (PgdA/CDA1 family)
MVKIAYLTIDDAPSEEFRQKVDFLLFKKIPTIFFCKGTRLEEQQDDAVYAIKKGFVIGNHSYNHPHFSKLSKEECFGQIEKTDKLIEEVYKKARIKRSVKVFRFPYGDKGNNEYNNNSWRDINLEMLKQKSEHSKELQNFLKRLGYKQLKFRKITYPWYKTLEKDIDIGWTYDTHDWRLYRGLDTIQDIFNRMEKSQELNSESADIIGMHDHPNSFELFKQIIERLLEKGIKFEMPKLI